MLALLDEALSPSAGASLERLNAAYATLRADSRTWE